MRITITLPDDRTWDHLCELAQRDLRAPKDQAVILILDGLVAAGVYDRTPVRRPEGPPPPEREAPP